MEGLESPASREEEESFLDASECLEESSWIVFPLVEMCFWRAIMALGHRCSRCVCRRRPVTPMCKGASSVKDETLFSPFNALRNHC